MNSGWSKNGSLDTYRGDLEQYTASRQDQAALTAAVSKTTVNSRKRQRQERAAARQSLHELRSTVKKLERQIEQGSEQLSSESQPDTETHAQMPADELSELLTDAATARKNLETLEERWLNVSAELEAELT